MNTPIAPLNGQDPIRSAPVLILCGGRGTRLQEKTHEIPKALVEIGGRPILWHVLTLYMAHGFRRFTLLTGYLGDQIERFATAEEWPDDATVSCLDTGIDTPTGGRVKRARELIDTTFCCTYADGLSDVDLRDVWEFHRGGGVTATMTVVRPRSQFGVVNLAADELVESFDEKPMLETWVNGGFFCFEPEVFEQLAEDSILERAPFEALASSRALRGYRHRGFWECMDTYKDAIELNALWDSGEPPWLRACHPARP